MLLVHNPNPMNVISIHLCPHHKERFNRSVMLEELLTLAMDTARRAKKPLFVGEFGASEELGPDDVRKEFAEVLSAIEEAGVPLAALWVYDLPLQDGTWNVTATNNRAYQLKTTQEANRRIQR